MDIQGDIKRFQRGIIKLENGELLIAFESVAALFDITTLFLLENLEKIQKYAEEKDEVVFYQQSSDDFFGGYFLDYPHIIGDFLADMQD